MAYLLGRYIIMILTIITYQVYYYNIYSKQQTSKRKLFIIFILQSILIISCFITGIYNSIITNFLFYVVNTFPLLIYIDTVSNKVFVYFVIFTCTAALEILISVVFIFVLKIFNLNVLFPQDLVIIESVLYFIPPIIIFFINIIIVRFIPYFFEKVSLLQLKKNVVALLIIFFLIIINESILFSTTKDNFILSTGFSIIFLLISLWLLNKNIDDFLKKQEQNIFYKNIISVQQKSLKSINQIFKNIRKRNHDYNNHLIIINELLKTDNSKALLYIEEVLKEYYGDLNK